MFPSFSSVPCGLWTLVACLSASASATCPSTFLPHPTRSTSRAARAKRQSTRSSLRGSGQRSRIQETFHQAGGCYTFQTSLEPRTAQTTGKCKTMVCELCRQKESIVALCAIIYNRRNGERLIGQLHFLKFHYVVIILILISTQESESPHLVTL
jgi:hypothetical protein